MKIKSCLIACGGRGYRLRKEGIKFSTSKSSLKLFKKSMLYWLLAVLKKAGFKKIVLASDSRGSLKHAKAIGKKFRRDFKEIKYHVRPRYGFIGLPYQARKVLAFPCLFEAGHSFQKPEDYKKMDKAYEKGMLVVAGFRMKSIYLPSRCVFQRKQNQFKFIGLRPAKTGELVAGPPLVVGKDFVSSLVKTDFSFSKILQYYAARKKLKIVVCGMPPEVDAKKEWDEAVPIYAKYIRKNNSH